ncbi:MAG: hypothetical protein V7K21_05175 [Nostoc sp.]|uniref:hypothetical protein n=1 Tax=Nostoc sp. TaxID=1180 RepID=UPI002FF7AA6E
MSRRKRRLLKINKILKQYRGFGMPEEFTRVRQWKRALKERESVKAIAHSKEFYIERYAKFAAPTLAAV